MWFIPSKRRPLRRDADSRRVRLSLERLEERDLLSGFTGPFVYTETNNPAGNAVLAYNQNSDGTLTQIGTFNTGGNGNNNLPSDGGAGGGVSALGPTDSSADLITTPDGRFLIAVNQGATSGTNPDGSISVFSILDNGNLNLVGTFDWGGVQPDSLGFTGGKLYVANRGNSTYAAPTGTATPNVTGFQLGGNGTLTAIAGSTVTFPTDTSPSQILITPDGKLLFVDNFAVPNSPDAAHTIGNGNTLVPYQIGASGQLTLAPGGAVGAPQVGANPPLLIGASFNPNAPIIYTGLALYHQVAVFTYSPTGQLTFVNGNATSTGTVTCWSAISADGKFLYTADNGSGSVAVFSLADPMNPVFIQEFTLTGPQSTPVQSKDFQLALSPDGTKLYAVNQDIPPMNGMPPTFMDGFDQLHTLSIDPTTGMLSEPTAPVLLSPTVVPNDVQPQGLVVVAGANANTSAFPLGANNGSGGTPIVNLNNNGALVSEATPFPGFAGAIRRATGVLPNGDQLVVWGAGPGGGPAVQVVDATTGQVLAQFYAFSPSFTGGVFVAVGDVNGDSTPDIIVGAGAGGGPAVKVIDGTKLGQVDASGEIADSALLASFYAYNPSFGGGVTVASGDFNGDGIDDIVTGAGPGGGPAVTVIDGTKLGQVGASGEIENSAQLASFYAYTPSFAGGVFVAVGDVNGDGVPDLITGAGAGGGPAAKVINGMNLGQVDASGEIDNSALLASFYAYNPAFTGGVRVDAVDVNGDGLADVVTGAGPGGGSAVKVIDAMKLNQIDGGGAIQDTALLDSFFAQSTMTPDGVFV